MAMIRWRCGFGHPNWPWRRSCRECDRGWWLRHLEKYWGARL